MRWRWDHITVMRWAVEARTRICSISYHLDRPAFFEEKGGEEYRFYPLICWFLSCFQRFSSVLLVATWDVNVSDVTWFGGSGFGSAICLESRNLGEGRDFFRSFFREDNIQSHSPRHALQDESIYASPLVALNSGRFRHTPARVHIPLPPAMASDEIVWHIINQQFCSFKLKLPGNSSSHQKSTKSNFCRNEHNVTGLCNRQSCPLANSRYATIRADPATGRLYLYIKTVERSHMPNKWWEKIRLSGNYTKALQQVDERLIYWPKFLLHKCKQRLTRLTQVRVRAQRLAKEQERLGETMVTRMAPKVRRREETRERKAEAAAKIERAIERELVERLRSGAYGDRPLNVEENVWRKVMRGLEQSKEGVRDEDLDEGIEEEVEEEYEREPGMAEEEADVEFVSDIDESEDEGDMEEFDDWLGGQSGDEEDADAESDAEDFEGSAEDDEEGDEEEDGEDATALKKKLDSLKRKRPAAAPAPKARKKPSKGPKTNIEYEYVPDAPQREMLLAK